MDRLVMAIIIGFACTFLSTGQYVTIIDKNALDLFQTTLIVAIFLRKGKHNG